jgi:5'-deoxynucleotidase YfbR-like HD superfamily hydrolase
MDIRTIADGFEYQVNKVFEDMLKDYKNEQTQRSFDGDKIQTFSEWLWINREYFGEKIYNRFDEYAGMDESTEGLNWS